MFKSLLFAAASLVAASAAQAATVHLSSSSL